MKFYKLFIGGALLVMLSNGAFAELKIIKREAVPLDDYYRYLKLVSEDGRPYWVAVKAEKPDPKTRLFFLQIEEFFDGRSPRRFALDVSHGFLPLGRQHGLLAMPNTRAEWSVFKLNKALSRVEKYGKLKSMLAVTETAKIGSQYIAGGMSKGKRPILVKMRDDLRIERELELQPKGQVTSVFALAGKGFAVVNFEDGSSEVLKLSPDLSILEKINLAGMGATGIPLRDGGFALTYTSLPGQDVFVERFNTSTQSLWKKKIFSRSGTSSYLYSLCELQDGLGLVGGNNNHLLVARIDENGQRVQLTEDTHTGVPVPYRFESYLVDVLDNKIHVRGMVLNPAGNFTSFHFVETATP